MQLVLPASQAAPLEPLEPRLRPGQAVDVVYSQAEIWAPAASRN